MHENQYVKNIFGISILRYRRALGQNSVITCFIFVYYIKECVNEH